MTTKNPKPPPATSASNVVQLRESVPAIDPEAEWNAQWNGCALRFSGSPTGRLVRLFDVVRWLMQTPRELPLAAAIDAVVSPFNDGEVPPVYLLDPLSFAKPLLASWSDTDKYFQSREALLEGSPITSAISRLRDALIQPRELSRLVNSVAYPTEYDQISETPFEFMARTASPGAYLAVELSTANRLWGWGRVVGPVVDATPLIPGTWPELVRYHGANTGHEWSPALKNIISIEHARRQGEKGLAKAMAAELGLTVTRLNELIRKKDESSTRKVIANRRTGT